MNTYYLGIDLNLPQDIKIIKLKRKLGFSGFGLYIELQLRLAQSDNYELSINDYADLAYEFRVEEKYIKDLVENFDLFEFENDKFFIQDIKTKMQLINAKKEAGRVAGLASGEARRNKKGTVVERSFERSLNNKGNKGKEINKETKEKETKVNNIKEKLLSFGLKENLLDLFLDLLEVRKNLKVKETDRALQLLIGKLNNNPQEAINMLNKSIENNWKGLYVPDIKTSNYGNKVANKPIELPSNYIE